MKTQMETSLETSWTNRVTLQVEADLDNSDPHTAAAIFQTMASRLRLMAEEVREANERALLEAGYTPPPEAKPEE